jgi:spore coat protein A
MINRPHLFVIAGIASGLALAPTATHSFSGFQKFADELPIPPRIQVAKGGPAELTITLNQFQAKMHRDFPAIPLWGYNGSTPGPTIEVEKGQKLTVHWANQLPTTHIIKAPTGFMQMDPMPDVRSVTHLHGGVVTQSSITDRFTNNNDGWPDAWIVPGQTQTTEYPNEQDSRILWYHDHAMAETGRNVIAGLAGMYLIHDDYERSLNLPSGDYDVPLIIQAEGINADGGRYYSSDISQEFYGNAVAVNGKLWPYMTVEPRKYRFRILNGSNARSYAMKFYLNNTQNPGPAIYHIGSDGGFLEYTAVLADPAGGERSPRLTLGPAERADVIIDFSHYAGQNLLLHNNSLEPGDGEIPIAQVMQFRVKSTVSAPDTSSLPMHMRAIPRLQPEQAIKTRQIVLTQETMGGMQMMMLNKMGWHDPITEKPVRGTTEIWELVNTTSSMHPFHIHLVNFQVLDRRPFDVDQYASNGAIQYTDAASPADPNEMGWKDVVQAAPRSVTRIIMNFTPYSGYYVYHCHILEHEDMDMMRPFQVVEP